MRRGPTRLAVTLSLITIACGVGQPWDQAVRPASGLPDRFKPDSSFTQEAFSDSLCLVHVIDPRGDPRLLLVRSTLTDRSKTFPTALGDYKVQPPGGYGVDEHQLVRVECRTGHPLGIVPE